MFSIFKRWFEPQPTPQTSPTTPSQVQQFSADVRVIGGRKSGKTTYMAALIHWPNADPQTSTVREVEAINEDGKYLKRKAQDILEKGDGLEGTPLDDIDAVKDYALRITLVDHFSWRKKDLELPSIAININCKDYSGELVDHVLQSPQQYKSSLEDYIEDCKYADGILFLIDGTSYRNDRNYANGIIQLLRELDRVDVGSDRKRRIALVLTKCEQPELWINRHKPREIAQARFKEVYQQLQGWEQKGAGNVDYFMVSAFGMLGKHYPEPNMIKLSRDRNGLQESVLKKPKQWKPFGLVAPIYWLCTGKRNPQLEEA